MTKELRSAARAVEGLLRRHRVTLTLGGEPTWVPVRPEGAEWQDAAVGPTKLEWARRFSAALRRVALPGSMEILAPGKKYAGEANPRWALRLIWRRDGRPLAPRAMAGRGAWSWERFDAVAGRLAAALGRPGRWLFASDPLAAETRVRVLPLDWTETGWRGERWPVEEPLALIETEGPSGLRLPLDRLPRSSLRRALVLELRGGVLQLFLPPYVEAGFEALLAAFECALGADPGEVRIEGYAPPASRMMDSLALACDPGVIEANLPVCRSWSEYAVWMERLCAAAESVGLRTFREHGDGSLGGTGGGNHLLFGGVRPELSPFHTRPGWVASILRYWHRHPCLGYLFTGIYAGPSSQAPRPDESGHEPFDLEIACRLLERRPAGDWREFVAASLRHLLTDRTGNTHRAEIALDKYWDRSHPSGCMGLLEFRALETLPRCGWMNAVALLWRGVLAMLLERPEHRPVWSHGQHLHDRWLLPAFLEADLAAVLRDLGSVGIRFPSGIFREISAWRFPSLFSGPTPFGGGFRVRAAHEVWPLIGEGAGGTSRLVDASLRRIEVSASRAFANAHRVSLAGVEPRWQLFPGGRVGFGLRFPALRCAAAVHPGIEPLLPLELAVRARRSSVERVFVLEPGRYQFRDAGMRRATGRHVPLEPPASGLVTCDLRQTSC